MALSDDVFPPDDRCEICGAELDDEIVIQEFADGSLARLCAECATGTAFDTDDRPLRSSEQSRPQDAASADTDPLETTKELLAPVVDLISLQREMQAALERLAFSLETFAAGVLTENLDKTAVVEDRVQALERELERTRARLHEAESRLSATAVSQASEAETEAAAKAAAGATGVSVSGDAAAQSVGEGPTVEAVGAVFGPGQPTPPADAVSAEVLSEAPAPIEVDLAIPATAIPAVPAVPPEAPAVAPPDGEPPRSFRLEEVQAIQRYFNDSPFTEKIRSVRHSLGRPQANLTRDSGPEPRGFVTVAWNIVWYQYLVDLSRDIPGGERVVLHREGMNLDDLTDDFKEKNASIDDDGRLDASELEVRLLSDPSALITEMTPDEERVLEDATEEIWDQRTRPEFKWDH
jgi:ribosome-binding protein aMBF1 (putative translation factor)